MLGLINAVDFVLTVWIWVIIAHAVLSYFGSPRYGTMFYDISVLLDRLTQPVLAPIRRVLPMTGPFDFSPLVAIVLLEVIERLLAYIFI